MIDMHQLSAILLIIGLAMFIVGTFWGVARDCKRDWAGIDLLEHRIKRQRRRHKRWTHLREQRDELVAKLPGWAK